MLCELSWYQWESCDGRMVKVEHKGTIEEALTSLNDQVTKFLLHVFIKRSQSKAFEDCKLEVIHDSDRALVQLDFSENYTAEYQDEIQSAHWHQKQISLFTVVIWYGDTAQSYVIVSDNLVHDKYAVCCYLAKILDEVRRRFPSVKVLDIFSDGAASQFKNKFAFRFLCTISENYSMYIRWQYFASHGKGAVDGVGGTVKRVVNSAVNCRQGPPVNSASTFIAAAEKHCPNIVLLEVSKEATDMFSKENKLEEMWDDVRSITGTQSYHYIEPVGPHSVRVKEYSTDEHSETHQFAPISPPQGASGSDLSLPGETYEHDADNSSFANSAIRCVDMSVSSVSATSVMADTAFPILHVQGNSALPIASTATGIPDTPKTGGYVAHTVCEIPDNIIIGDFYLIRFGGTKTVHDFVSQVTDYDATLDLHQVKSLRKHSQTGNTFIYPTSTAGKEDISWVELPRQLLKKLPQPHIDKRNRVHFSIPVAAE